LLVGAWEALGWVVGVQVEDSVATGWVLGMLVEAQ
jgi:hypothetical protein